MTGEDERDDLSTLPGAEQNQTKLINTLKDTISTYNNQHYYLWVQILKTFIEWKPKIKISILTNIGEMVKKKSLKIIYRQSSSQILITITGNKS